MILVNFTNHPSERWSAKQTYMAEKYGAITDIPFPHVSPTAMEHEVEELAKECVSAIVAQKPTAVLCQGEFSLCFSVTQKLLVRNITVLCACSERKVAEATDNSGNTEKRILFEFVQFRKYAGGEYHS